MATIILAVPAFTTTPVDTTGAGDTFAAGLLYGLTHGLPHGKIQGRIASFLAAQVVNKLEFRVWTELITI